MKLYKLIFASALFFTAVISCDDFGDLNVDPNSATAVDPSNLVSYAQFIMYDRIHGRALNMEHGKLMVQHWSQNEYAEESRYQFSPGVANNAWFDFYTDVLKELEVAKELIEAQSIAENVKTNQKAIIDILKVNAYMLLTDTFGDIPYSQAINNEFESPAYDAQEAVYSGMMSTLQSAATSIDPNAPSFSSGDIIYNGSISHWKRFAHSLLLRMALRVSDASPSLASQYAAVAASDLITSHADEPRFIFDSAPDRSNPMWRDKVLGSRDDFCISDVLVSVLNDLNDPRLAMFADPAPGNTQIVGMPYGLDDNSASVLKSSTSRPHADLLANTAHHVIVSLSEVKFLLAEAYQRGILTGNAETAYNEAVTASMQYWGITDAAAIEGYLTANAYDEANWKASIGLQKWISLYTSGTEAWAEWRRLDQPVLTPSVNGVIPTIPVKLNYPQSEEDSNGSNLGAVSSDPTSLIQKVWWDVN